MPVHAGAFVPGGYVGQVVGCLDLEYSKNVHWPIVPMVLLSGNNRTRKAPPASGLAARLRRILMAIAERLLGGLSAAAKRGLHGQKLLAFAVVDAAVAAQ